MGLFNKKKNQGASVENSRKLNDELKDDISKAYDELVSGDVKEENAEIPETEGGVKPDMELLKAKILEFKEKKSQEALFDVLKLLPQKVFMLPTVSNMEQPFEQIDGKMKPKEGAEFNPALLTAPDKKLFLPVFTDEKAMTQKSPSGVVLNSSFEQCMGIVMNEQNTVSGIVINPFSENMILGEDLLKTAFKKVEKN